tara:strand:+ start:4656 stop:4949 length:294 start_codon:yes stop_codon:yes gene_type:complete
MVDWKKFIGKDNEIDSEGMTAHLEARIPLMDEMVKNILVAKKEINSFCKSSKKEQKFHKKNPHLSGVSKHAWTGTPPFDTLRLLVANLEKNIKKIKG